MLRCMRTALASKIHPDSAVPLLLLLVRWCNSKTLGRVQPFNEQFWSHNPLLFHSPLV